MRGDGVRVLVVGAGIAGLAAARTLHEWGASVEVIDRQPTSPLEGTGIFLPGNAVRALGTFGLEDQVARRAAGILHQRTLDDRGRTLFEVETDELWHGVASCLALSRADLHQLLLSALVDYLAAFDLVTFDVLNRLITRLGGNPDVGNKETMQLTDNLFDPLAQRGSCVLVLDHPNKKGQRADATVNDPDPGGGVLKMNNLSGMSLGMLPLKRFTRDNPAGRIDLFCLKDRPGHYEELALIGHMLGSMDINERGLGLSLEITPPDETELVVDTHDRDVQAVVDRITEILTKRGAMSRRDVKNSITTRLRKCFDEAVVRTKYDLETLVEEGRTLRLHVAPPKT